MTLIPVISLTKKIEKLWPLRDGQEKKANAGIWNCLEKQIN